MGHIKIDPIEIMSMFSMISKDISKETYYHEK